jgi:outer membrane immunogenic protein
MNALLKTSLLGLALLSTASMAGNFAGPEAGASVTMNGGSTLLDNKISNNYDGNYGQQSIGIKLHGGYGFDLGNDTLVLVGFGYNPTEIKSGTNNGTVTKLKNSWSLSVAPGMMLNDKSLAYVKLSYEAGKYSSKDSASSTNESISGVGYGLGLRTEINKSTFLETEIKQVNYKKFTYKSASDITPSATVGSVGLVFKF